MAYLASEQTKDTQKLVGRLGRVGDICFVIFNLIAMIDHRTGKIVLNFLISLTIRADHQL